MTNTVVRVGAMTYTVVQVGHMTNIVVQVGPMTYTVVHSGGNACSHVLSQDAIRWPQWVFFFFCRQFLENAEYFPFVPGSVDTDRETLWLVGGHNVWVQQSWRAWFLELFVASAKVKMETGH